MPPLPTTSGSADKSLVAGSDDAFGWDTGWDDPAIGMMLEPLQAADTTRQAFEHHILNTLSSQIGQARMAVGAADATIRRAIEDKVHAAYATFDGLVAPVETRLAGAMGQAAEYVGQLAAAAPNAVTTYATGPQSIAAGGWAGGVPSVTAFGSPIVSGDPLAAVIPGVGGVQLPPGAILFEPPPGWLPGDLPPGAIPVPPGWIPGGGGGWRPPPGWRPPVGWQPPAGWQPGDDVPAPPGAPGGPPAAPGAGFRPEPPAIAPPQPPRPPRPPFRPPPDVPPVLAPPVPPGGGGNPGGGINVCVPTGPGQQGCQVLPAPPTGGVCPPCDGPECWYDYRDPCNCGDGGGGGASGGGNYTGPDTGLPRPYRSADLPTGRPDDATPLGSMVPAAPATGGGNTVADRRARLANSWRVYQSLATCQCYVAGPGAGPNNSSDFLLYAGDSQACVADKCPTRPATSPPATPPPPLPTPPLFSADLLDALCERMKELASGPAAADAPTLSERLGLRIEEPGWLDTITAAFVPGGILPAAMKVVISTLAGVLDFGDGLMRAQLAELSCLSGQNVAVHVTKIALGVLRKYVSDDFGDLQQALQYVANYTCSLGLPTADVSLNAYLRDAIDLEHLECMVKVNGQAWGPYQPMIEAARTRAPVTDQVALWRRRIIDDAEFASRVRQHGFLRDSDVEEAKLLSVQIPPVSELLRMMLRDVADEATIDWTSSDQLFAEKFKGQLREWSEAQGIEEEFAKFIWRAHWFLPSPTQLFEMLHRLRHDPNFGGPAQFERAIRNALLQQDIHPEWVDTLMRISYRPLTRVDTRRAYDIDVLTREDVKRSYMDQGYDDQNAETLTKFTEQLKLNRLKGHKAAKAFAAGELNQSEAESILREAGATPEMLPGILERAAIERRQRTRKRCLAGYRRRFLAGEFNRNDAVGRLMDLGLDGPQAGAELSAWECERTARPKHLTASTLCDWLSHGLINVVDFVDRMVAAGWTKDDAVKIVRRCNMRITEAEQKRIDAEEKARLAQQARDEAERKRLDKEAERERAAAERKEEAAREKRRKLLERLEKQQAAATIAATKARERRQDSMLEIAASLLSLGAADLGSATRDVTSAVASVSARPSMTTDEAIEVVAKAVESLPRGGAAGFRQAVEEFARANQSIEAAT